MTTGEPDADGIFIALLAALVRADFTAIPDLRVTTTQARERWPLDARTCGLVLGALCDEGFLVRTGTGEFTRP